MCANPQPLPWSGQPAGRPKAISPPLFLREGLAQFLLLLFGQVGRDDLEVVLLSSSTTLSGAVAPLVRAKRAEVPSVTLSRTSFMKSSLIPTSANDPERPPMLAPIAAPRKGTKKISPNRKPQKAPLIAPMPAVLCSWWVLGFLLPWGQLTTAASSRVIIARSCMPCRASSTRSAP